MKKMLVGISIVIVLVVAGGLIYEFSADSQQPTPSPPATSIDDLKSDKPGLRVLFVGNSHTFTNDLPGMVTKLANGAGVERPLLARSEAPGGTSFQMHVNNGKVQRLLGEVKWDLVVLQDQSAMPLMSPEERRSQTLPAARELDAAIRKSGARTVLFMTWAYRDSFVFMQPMARTAYTELAADLKADLVPVGTAWEEARRARPALDLWSDGNHATMKGTYLAACVFFAAFYGQSPVGNSYTATVEAAEARFLQEIAAKVVDPKAGGLAAKAPSP
jgi:hypothetical protein